MSPLPPLPVDASILQRMLDRMLPAAADDGDIYLQRMCSESLALEEGRVKHVAASTHQGLAARVVRGEASGHACTDSLDTAALMDTARAARAIVDDSNHPQIARLHAHKTKATLYPAEHPALDMDFGARRACLAAIDTLARGLDTRVCQVFASLNVSHSEVFIARMDGALLHDVRPLVRLNVSVVVEQDGRRETGSFGGGGRQTLKQLLDTGAAERFTREAVRLALLNLEAREAPAGTMPVVLGPGWPGILLHEAVGHGLEGDFNRKGTSVFARRIGERIAAPGVTVVDDGAIPGRRGSLTIDDEGTPTGRTVLIEDGILIGYLLDRQNARLLGMQPTGNGRRESYAHPVLPRMTNTFMLAGSESPEAIVQSLQRGIYAVNFGGGQVDITSGKFVFTTSEAYYVEQGRIQYPVKGATLIGSGHEVLRKISMIGNDLALDPGVGTCGKAGQSVPVGVGLPTVRVDELIVGGTEVGGA
ncbi:MAG: metalloprotease TldD [Zetaproteobacteria bacterium]|nr:MAG: metalloprotease TldD [Zetaproteobacteria bacterium]